MVLFIIYCDFLQDQQEQQKPVYSLDPNVYATKKTVAQGFYLLKVNFKIHNNRHMISN